MYVSVKHLTAACSLSCAIAVQAADLVANLLRRIDVAPGIELRILPLGASITLGYGSSDANGYRLYLQEDLASTTLQYVGSMRNGSMSDNYHEGHSGFTIRSVVSFTYFGSSLLSISRLDFEQFPIDIHVHDGGLRLSLF